jgi:starch-binding outer membrane protein, SusD/RagB family
MKKIIILSFLSTALLTSCGDDFLDLKPHSQANVESFYQTPNDVEVAVTGVYRTLQLPGQFGQSIWTIGEVASDNSLAGRPVDPYQDIAAHRIPSTNGVVENTWFHNYQGIQSANTVLQRMQSVTFANQELKNRLEGEAKFLRALMYFNLVRVYGDVPLVLTESKSVEEGYQHGRTPVSQVYEQIIKDLSEASADGVLPTQYPAAQRGRATKGAAKALLGKVYLTLNNFQQAANQLKQVIDLGTYQLLPDYASVFNVNNLNNAESVFEVQFKKATGQGLGSSFFHTFAPFTSGNLITKNGAGQGFGQPTLELIGSYKQEDKRKAASLQEGFVNAKGEFIPEPWISKYMDPAPAAANDNDNNFPVIRYADVCLMYAEALNELKYGTEAFTYLNMVRARAGLDPIDNQALPDQQSFRLAVEEERRLELAFEGHRWFDLIRTNRLLPVMNAKGFSLQEYQKIFPVPQTQIDVNPSLIKQNPGHVL